jgi:hypothetical protein
MIDKTVYNRIMSNPSSAESANLTAGAARPQGHVLAPPRWRGLAAVSAAGAILRLLAGPGLLTPTEPSRDDALGGPGWAKRPTLMLAGAVS